MTAQIVLTNPNNELRKISEPVLESEIGTTAISNLIKDLIETMDIEKGVGIAAPQIGVLKRVIIIDTGKGPQAFLNPEIISKSISKIEGEEGCLSVPGVFGIVKRHKRIKIQAMLENGERVTIKASDFSAVVFQHETDHLNGILFIDKVIRYTKQPNAVL